MCTNSEEWNSTFHRLKSLRNRVLLVTRVMMTAKPGTGENGCHLVSNPHGDRPGQEDGRGEEYVAESGRKANSADAKTGTKSNTV